MVKVEIEPDQVSHFNKILEILRKYPGYGDTSECGLGKTILVIKTGLHFGLPLFVVTCKSAQYKWIAELEKYECPYVEVINYERLSIISKTKKNWINKIKINDKTKLLPTDEFLEKAKKGMLLVFDEMQYVKKDTAIRTKAAHALTRALAGTGSRSCFLSNTPVCKNNFSNSIVKILGLVTRKKMYDYDPHRSLYVISGHGLAQLFAISKKINPEETLKIKQKFPLDSKNIKIIAYWLYKRILKKEVLSSMPRPEHYNNLTIYNAFYRMKEEDNAKIDKGYKILRGWVNEVTGERVSTLSVAQTLIEKGKIPKIVEIVTQKLKKEPMKKFIIYVNRVASMKKLKAIFNEYGALIMNCKVIGQNRIDAINAFQEDSNRCRVLITSSRVGGVGLDLDDKIGTREREVYIIPSYGYIMDYQGARRVMRRTTKSHAKVYNVYSSAFPEEKILINQIIKSEVHKNVVNDENDMLEVNKHEVWYEFEEDRK